MPLIIVHPGEEETSHFSLILAPQIKLILFTPHLVPSSWVFFFLLSCTNFVKGLSFPPSPILKNQSWPCTSVLSLEIWSQEGSVSTRVSPGHPPPWLLARDWMCICVSGAGVNFQSEEPRCLGPRGGGRWDGPGTPWRSFALSVVSVFPAAGAPLGA